MTKLKALIVDDEDMARKNLVMLLEEFCPEIEVLGEAANKAEAKEKIEELKPDVLFLDIRMPSGSEGFELLEEIENRDFLVVFVTAFKDFAIRAFQANAIHYLLKPIDIDDLRSAVEKVAESAKLYKSTPEGMDTYYDTIKNLSNQIHSNQFNNRLAISHTKGLKIVEDDTISYLEASGNCTTIYFTNGKRYLDTRTLKIYEEILNPDKFYRVHKSYIINLNELVEYLNEDGHTAVLKDGKHLPVARNRVSAFLKLLKGKH
ncbi:two component transcriptional regulator, LytTR family [Lishizhenia tianjinensis]|uniref:Two component transcriptional regulator, LytTR family n=1 Tax=Lishizhenia tianjinensis TaxID=477690 RepID=A0A1I6ZS46_9FLAO|nr:LytTR family DNA-binding domain-containing protein [Lishizhenia tianjinensis]SFT65482.1 two component transcriptional regulator, LytTR family [Lishizhenia tianjinensis]